MENLVTGKDIIVIAKTYLGTPWKHQGRLKHKGIDCAGYIVKVMEELGLDISFDLQGYERIPDGQKLAQIAHDNGKEVLLKDIKDGDVILFNILGNPQHLAFYYQENGINYILHAYGDKSVNKVVAMRLDSKWKNRICGVYRINGVE